MEEETDILRQHRVALDRTAKQVLPDSWEGHGRLAIRDSDLPKELEPKAITVLNNLADKKPEAFDEHGAETVANRVIAKLTE